MNETILSKQNRGRLLIIVGLILGITALHYTTGTDIKHAHDIYRRLYYVPIVLGGVWFTLRGGVGAAIAASILYAPHVIFQWGHHPAAELEQYLEILLYNIIGFLTGSLAYREQAQKQRYRLAAQHLEESYQTLKSQADQILEIEEQLRRADRLSALGELSAGMAHEIRNPLGSIRGTAEILKENVDVADPKYEFAEILVKEVDRLNRVLEDFLRFAKPAPVERDLFDVNEALSEVLDLTRQQALKNRVEVSFDEGSLADIPGDREQLKQAFLNLVLNALQIMPEGGRLMLSSVQDEKHVLITFRDTGPGIAPAEIQRIFNPFVTTRDEGTGLGLAITQRIIQGHAGRIDVESTYGKGAVFTVCLPLNS
jgi:signal transduction histidine kinase